MLDKYIFSIYVIKSRTGQKSYIGKTVQKIKSRFNAHMSEALRGLYFNYFHNSIRTYGKDDFYYELLEEIHDSEDIAYQREIHWIKELNTVSPNGYNSHSGGKGGLYNPSPELRLKLSLAKKDYIPWNKGKKMSPEYCKTISEARKGMKFSKEHRENLRKPKRKNRVKQNRP